MKVAVVYKTLMSRPHAYVIPTAGRFHLVFFLKN